MQGRVWHERCWKEGTFSKELRNEMNLLGSSELVSKKIATPFAPSLIHLERWVFQGLGQIQRFLERLRLNVTLAEKYKTAKTLADLLITPS